MTDGMTHEEREAIIAGAGVDAMTAAERADLALLADLLGDPDTWAEPGAGLEDAVVRAVAAADPAAPSADRARRRRTQARPRRLLASVAASAAAVAVVLGALVATAGGPGADYTARLAATGLAPGAHATVSIHHNRAGFRVSLDASGLPKLASGQYYQAWLKNAAGDLVPIGTFSSSDGRITLWSGVSPSDFPNLSVTIEPRDNDPGSSGRKVLIGRAHAT